MDRLLTRLKSYGDFKNFTRADSSKWDKEDLGTQVHKNCPDRQSVLNFFTYVDHQLSKKDFPLRLSEGERFMTYLIKGVMIAVRCHSVYKNSFNEELFDLMTTCIKAGPGSGHLEVMRELPIEKDYFNRVDSERLGKFLAAYSLDILTDPLPEDDLKSCLTDNVRWPFIRGIKEELFQPHKQLIGEIWVSKQFQLTECSEAAAYILAHLGYILKNLVGNPYNYKETEIITGHLDRIRDAMVKQEFPLTKYSEEAMKDTLKFMVSFLKKEDSIRREVISYFNGMVLDVTTKGNEAAIKVLASDSTSFLTKYNKEIKRSATQSLETMNVILSRLKTTKTRQEAKDFEKDFGSILKENYMKTITPDDWKISIDLVLGCLDCGQDEVMKIASSLMDKRKSFDWKKTPKAAKMIFDKLLTLGEDTDRNTRNYEKFCDKFFSHLNGQRVLQNYHDQLMEINVKAFSGNESLIRGAARASVQKTNWAQNEEHMHEILAIIDTALQENPEMEKYEGVGDIINFSLMFLFQDLSGGQDGAAIVEDLAKIFHLCMDREWKTNGNNETVEYIVLKDIMEDYLYKHKNHPECLEPMLEDVKILWECGDERLERDADNIIKGASNSATIMGEEKVSEIIQKYLDGGDQHAINDFQKYYEQMPQVILNRLDDIVGKIESGDNSVHMGTISLIYNITKENPQVIGSKSLDVIANNLEGYVAIWGIQILQMVAKYRTKDVIRHEDKILNVLETNRNAALVVPNTLVAITVSEKSAIKYLDILATEAQNYDSMQKLSFYYAMRKIGANYRHALSKHKPLFEKEKKDNSLSECCQSVIDVIEGRSLAGLSDEVAEHGEQINQLEDRVDATEDNVENLSREVENTQTDVLHLQEETAYAGERLNTLEDVVEETVERVDELDLKTLSHAPAWSPEVSKLMNPEAEHDWRLLASRLGYTIDDIKNWATQPDPCLSLLDEWFATHKTREATYAVLKCLEDMSREDAAVIVHDALAAVEDLIDEEPPDLEVPPPVFISYQWGLQQECKLLKKHLEMAGFKAWMDIGQMGGGDKLYAKIDEGIRAAKVVICCVSEKYAQSPNCNREVNLSVTLGKPIIPLLMEKMSWPPPGSMGPIFGEYLFIRFFQRSAETNEATYWPVPKFQELLMQLRYSIVPDESVIAEEYKDWWAPPEEVIVIQPKGPLATGNTSVTGGGSVNNDKSDLTVSPDIFISYQWGKQPQIKALYKRLSQLGFTCWLDIMQMGGGDSLYDKIDRGVRGCKIVISCVTTKYSLSANCRREVSLADALKKPIIPLLLEQMTWPPEGPMSMPFTQLLYISFCKPDESIQNSWECPQFEELLQKIIGYVRPIMPSEKQVKETILPNDKVASKKEDPIKTSPHTTEKQVPSRPSSGVLESKSRPRSAQSNAKGQPSTAKPVVIRRPKADDSTKSAISSRSASVDQSPIVSPSTTKSEKGTRSKSALSKSKSQPSSAKPVVIRRTKSAISPTENKNASNSQTCILI